MRLGCEELDWWWEKVGKGPSQDVCVDVVLLDGIERYYWGNEDNGVHSDTEISVYRSSKAKL